MRPVLGIAVLAILAAPSSKGPREITRAEARALVLKALQTQGAPTMSRKFDLEDNTGNLKYFPDFYSFDAYLDEPGFLSIYGHYSVNRKTADLWDEKGCQRVDAAAIRPLQRSLRKKIGLSASEYRKLSSEAPCSPN